jgi:tetratricopeptide (TPR) repeat protein
MLYLDANVMKFFCPLPAALICTTAIVIIHPKVILALSPTGVNKIAKGFTVKIGGQNHGSGVIIKRDGNIYTVLTAAHVVESEDSYKIITPDNKVYPVKSNTIKHFSGIDLAVAQFSSTQKYSVAKMGNSQKAVAGTPCYAAGFPFQTSKTTSIYQFRSGLISANASHPLADGYALAYWNYTFAGMSGGPLLDSQGELIGIHGRSLTPFIETRGINPDSASKQGLSLAVPISIFLKLSSQGDTPGKLKNAISEANPKRLTADDHYIQAVDKLRNKRKAEALSDFENALRLDPDFAPAYLYRGTLRALAADRLGAIADYNQAIRLWPNFAEAYNMRGNAYSEDNKQAAIADYTQAIRLQFDYIQAYTNRGSTRMAIGDKQGAISDHTQAIRLQPNYAPAYLNRGVVYSISGDQKSALADFDQAIRLQPDYAKPYHGRGLIREGLGDLKGALSDFDQAIRLNINFAPTYDHRGILRSKFGDDRGAIADFDQVIRLQPENSLAYYNRGISRLKLRDKKAAITDFQKAIPLAQKDGNIAVQKEATLRLKEQGSGALKLPIKPSIRPLNLPNKSKAPLW